MAKKTIGKWERDPVTKQAIYFVNYCATCKDKVFLSAFQAQQFINEIGWSIERQSFWAIIKNKLLIKIPRFKISIEYGKAKPEESGEVAPVNPHQHFREQMLALNKDKYGV